MGATKRQLILAILIGSFGLVACSDDAAVTPKDMGPEGMAPDSQARDLQGGDGVQLDTAMSDGTMGDQGGDLLPMEEAGAGDGGISCTPDTRRCTNDTAEVCVAAGNAWNGRLCGNGCENGECKPMSLETGWKVHQYDLTDDSIKTPANYTFEQNGLVALQSANPMASIYYKDEVLPEGIKVTGSFAVETTADDDVIGFVFGWQDPQHYFLLDWKQADQSSGSCGTAKKGASLKLVKADTTIDKCADFWSSDGTTKVTPIVGVDQNPTGWVDNMVYTMELIFRPGDIRISIKDDQGTEVVKITSDANAYRSGKFGFYNYSQESVRYKFFAISPMQ